MNGKLLLSLAIIAAIVFLIITFSGSKDNFGGLYGSGSNPRSCRDQCADAHPEAARMYEDEDNSVASTVMDQCIASCEIANGKKCKSCA
jgi:hypothetical protein